MHSLPENMKLNKAWTFQICQIHLNYFGSTPPFLLQENRFKNANFSGFLSLKEPLVAALNEASALTWRTYVAQKSMTIPNLSETLGLLCPKPKMECNQMDLNISDQCETLIPCSTIYFLVLRARLLQNLATESSSIGRKTSWFAIFEGIILK